MLKFSLNLAIVAMVVPRAKTPITSQCGSNENVSNSTIASNVTTVLPILSQNISVKDIYKYMYDIISL